MSFTWIPFFNELFLKVVKEHDPLTLAKIAYEILPEKAFFDSDEKGNKFRLEELDPATFLARFNRAEKKDSRIEYCRIAKKVLNLKADIPNDFDGIPTFNPQKSMMFAFKYERADDDIQKLWAFCKDLAYGELKKISFNDALTVKYCGATYLTMICYIVWPEKYLPLDANTKAFVSKKSKEASDLFKLKEFDDPFKEYNLILEKIRTSYSGSSFQEISRQAWESAQNKTDVSYFWLNANPKQWNPKELEVGSTEFYTSRNDDGNKRRIYSNFEEVRPGDLLLGYVTTPENEIAAIFEVTKGLHKDNEDVELIEFKLIKKYDTGLKFSDFRDDPELVECAPIKNNQGSLFKLKQEEYEHFIDRLTKINIESRSIQYWIIAPGEDADQWNNWQKDSLIAVGWDKMGDLQKYRSQADLKEKYLKQYEPKNNPSNNTKALYEFCNELRIGDIVFVKDGRTAILGVGKVSSENLYDIKRTAYKNYRKVDWLAKGNWPMENGEKLVLKTLTNITKYTNYPDQLLNLTGLSYLKKNEVPMASESSLPSSINTIFWGPPGTGKTYSLLKLQQLFTDAGSNKDEIISWVQELGWWEVVAAAMIELNRPVSVPELMEHEFVQIKVKLHPNNKTPKNTLWGKLQAHTVNESKNVSYQRRLEPLVVDKNDKSQWSLVGDWKDHLDDLIQNIIKLRSKESKPKSERFRVVTFHQSYSYEEFIEGIRPEINPDGTGITYQVKDGIFKTLCKRALENQDLNYAIFIDEINRGNISKIFGELISLIETDKRKGAAHQIEITLPYSGEKFSVPKNLFIIGTMNSVDRSIALVDMALRRRFEFISVRPNSDLVEGKMIKGADLKLVFESLNSKISVILGTEYQIGHSYFMGENTKSIKQFKKTWFGSVLPLLQEYLFDDWEKIEVLVGPFVEKKDVKGLEKISLPKYSFGTFKNEQMPDDVFVECLKTLEK